jgi:hypothetical protein
MVKPGNDFTQVGAIGLGAARILAEDLGTAGARQRCILCREGLPVCRNSGVPVRGAGNGGNAN